jgi:cytochrome c oxidase subunit 2
MPLSSLIKKLALAGSVTLSYVALTGVAQQNDTPLQISVVAKRFTYMPSEITVKKGQPVVLLLKSQDVAHGLKFKELDLQTEIEKNGTSTLAFTPTKAGDFVGRCSHFCGSGHGSMILTMHVTE